MKRYIEQSIFAAKVGSQALNKIKVRWQIGIPISAGLYLLLFCFWLLTLPGVVMANEPGFQEGRPFDDTQSLTYSGVTGDMDEDGDLDIVVGNAGQNAVCMNDGLGNFPVIHDFGTGTDNTQSVAIGDVDGDGDLDIVTGNSNQNNVVYLNDGSGNFPIEHNFGIGIIDTTSVALGDIDGDGDLDIVAGSTEQNAVYLNDGLGNYLVSYNFGTGTDSTKSVAVEDMDGDSDLDIVVGNAGQNAVYMNDGLGNFPVVHDFGADVDNTRSVAIGDVDGDGDLDIVTGNSNQNNVVYLNDGNGNFPIEHNFGIGINATTSVALGDIDGDGDLDIVTGREWPNSSTPSENPIYLNDGVGNFAFADKFGTSTEDTKSISLGDIDGDSDFDIITANFGQNIVYLNDGNGKFPPSRAIIQELFDMTNSIAVGDVDGDGDLDIVTGNSDEYYIFARDELVFLNDGSGNFPVSNRINVLGESNDNNSLALGDMDGDGDLDIIFGNNYTFFGQPQNAVYLNDGSGNFLVEHSFGAGTANTLSVAVADMDDDGDLDIVTGNDGQNALYLNDGLGNFPISHNFGTGADYTESVALGDVDGDGDLDIVTGNSLSFAFLAQNVVYLNDGSGNFPIGHNFGTGADDTVSVALGDMDNDGDLDIVTGNSNFSSLTAQDIVYLNDGQGNFPVGHDFGVDTELTDGLTVGDIDGDSDLDIIARTSMRGWPFMQNEAYLNDGSGNFTAGTSFGANTFYGMSIAAGDMDRDGDLDVVTGNAGQNIMYLNDGTGEFPIDKDFGSAPHETTSIALGDMDSDGDLDIVTGFNRGYPYGGVSLNDGNGNILRPGIYNYFNYYYPILSIGLGDIDGDDDLDVVIGGDGGISVNLNDGLGNILGTRSVGTGTGKSVSIGDMDGDGDLDIVACNYKQQNTIYLNDGLGNFPDTLDFGTGVDPTQTAALGDVDGDGDLDIIVGNYEDYLWYPNHVVVYLNDGSGNFSNNHDINTTAGGTNSLGLGDVDGDGDLDLVSGNRTQNVIYLNDSFGYFPTSYSYGSAEETQSVALGDRDGDGDLDIVTGNYGPSIVYLNDGNGGFPVGHNFGPLEDDYGPLSKRVMVGDMDGDGDLDIVMNKNSGGTEITLNAIYPSPGTSPIATMGPVSTTNAAFSSSPVILDTPVITVPFSQYNPEGTHVGSLRAFYSLDGGDNWRQAIALTPPPTIANIVGYWPLDEGVYTTTIDASGHGMTATLHDATWTDDTAPTPFANPYAITFDGINDYVEVSHSASQNTGEELTLAAWVKLDSIADGKIMGKGLGAGYVLGFSNGNLYPEIWDTNGNRYSFQSGDIPVGIWTHLAITWSSGGYLRGYINGALIGEIEASTAPIGISSFPLRIGASSWDSAAHLVEGNVDEARMYDRALSAMEIASLASNMPAESQCVGICDYTFNWDVYASGFFGKSDNVVLRLEAYTLPTVPGIAGTYRYTNTIPGPFQRPYASVTTFPFRVRGTQVQVFTDTVETGNELSGAIVYRLPAGQTNDAMLMAKENSSLVWQTDTNGYLQGRGQLGPGDQIMALLPVSSTSQYTLYHTSATPTAIGPNMFTVDHPGVQQIAISPENKLLLFNLDVTLEWDARQDTTFLNQLENDLKRTSQILYDLSNGQAALGRVRVYHNRENLRYANVVIQADNTQRPSAILGGIVLTPTSDIGVTGIITNAYLPGQVRMGPTWNRFGDPGGTIGEDWPRALAHELGHYLFFVPDNYLGLTEEGFLTVVDCQGSVMTNPYASSYSEFLSAGEWNGACLDTLQANYLGRSDWQTINAFYPMLNGASGNVGPNQLPLAVTEITFIEPVTDVHTLVDPFFNLIDITGDPAPLPMGRGQAYLIRTQGTNDPTDDLVVKLGSPVGDLVQARGAVPGDRLCVYDYDHEPLRLGCLHSLGNQPEPLTLQELTDWAPQIQVQRETTRTFNITVTNVSESALSVQLLPNMGKASTEQAMTQVEDSFVQTIVLPDRAFSGYVRVWVPNSEPIKEFMTEFAITEEWNGQAFAWGGQAFAWGAQAFAWGAPLMSSDGQVSVFNLDNLFGSYGEFTLQALPLSPNLPSWLALVGSAYRLEADREIPKSAISFRYLGKDVPAGYEDGIRIYYSPDNGQNWQRLVTELDTYYNHASAPVLGEGIYALISTIETPPLYAGWNLFAYPDVNSRPVSQALASIADDYTSVYYWNSSNNPEWLIYDRTVQPAFATMVNDLDELSPLHSYWIYALQNTTPYIGVNSNQRQSLNLTTPPATFYGWITSTLTFRPRVGDPIIALIDGHICGQSVVSQLNESKHLAYKIQVFPDSGNGCGTVGRMIQFVVSGQTVPNDHVWGNSQACYLPLGLPSNIVTDCFPLYESFLPVVSTTR